MFKLSSFLRSLFRSRSSSTGVLPDTRSDIEKAKDYTSEERLIAGVPDPFGNTQIIESPYFYENQNRTYSCVAHAAELALAIERKADQGPYVRLSPMFAYRLRQNYSGEGCYPQNIFDVLRSKGAPPYSLLPTPQTEGEANSVTLTPQLYTEAEYYKGLNYFAITNYTNINTLATIAMQGHGIAILIYGTQDEWGREYPEIQVPNLPLTSSTEIRHCVCVLPNSGFMKDGKKYVTIQDSAWFGGRKIRHLSEEWIAKRTYGATYWDTVVLTTHPPPLYRFTKILEFGARGEEVQWMQKFLISQGLLPTDCATGYFGGLSLKAVKDFQTRYKDQILTPIGLSLPTGHWGLRTIQKANEIAG